MLIETLSQPCYASNTANITAASITEPVPTTTLPSGTGVITLGDKDGQQTASAIKLFPYGVGADGNTFNMNVYGWERVPAQGTAGQADLWVPALLCTLTTCTLDSAQPGVANTPLGTTQLFCRAITLGVGNSGISVEVISAGTGKISHVVVDTKGAKLIEVRFAVVTATSANALWRKM